MEQCLQKDFVTADVWQRTSASSPPTNAVNYQRQLRLSLSELTALLYRVSDETCQRHNLTELCDVLTAMRQHVIGSDII